MTERKQPAQVPVTIVVGFLSADKTTLLNHILNENHDLRTGALVNDFDGIDNDALQRAFDECIGTRDERFKGSEVEGMIGPER